MPRATHTCPHASTQHPHSPRQESEKRDCPQTHSCARKSVGGEAHTSKQEPHELTGHAKHANVRVFAQGQTGRVRGGPQAMGASVHWACLCEHCPTQPQVISCPFSPKNAQHTTPTHAYVPTAGTAVIDPTTSVKRQQLEAAAGWSARFLHAHGLTQKDRPPPAL